MRFPTNFLVAFSYGILFHKLKFDIEFTNPPEIPEIESIAFKKEVTEILERNILHSFEYLERDEVKKNPSSCKLELKGV
jgi:hypothetical protein